MKELSEEMEVDRKGTFLMFHPSFTRVQVSRGNDAARCASPAGKRSLRETCNACISIACCAPCVHTCSELSVNIP